MRFIRFIDTLDGHQLEDFRRKLTIVRGMYPGLSCCEYHELATNWYRAEVKALTNIIYKARTHRNILNRLRQIRDDLSLYTGSGLDTSAELECLDHIISNSSVRFRQY